MIVTEDEAKTKRCQESYAAATGVSSGGYAYPGPVPPISMHSVAYQTVQTAPTMCIGSACMAWRWLRQEDHDMPPNVRSGYCGKAGRP